MKGLFITFEGIEGCGKSTQAKLLEKHFRESGKSVLFTREPGGTELGRNVRKLLLDSGKVYPIAELFLFLADRNQHVREEIVPALERGTVVICDRFYHSTFAYQAGGRKVDFPTVQLLNDIAIEQTVPDLSFYIDVPVEIGFSRKNTMQQGLDRIESEDRSFHESIRNAYLKLVQEDDRLILIDGSRDKAAVSADIQRALKSRFPTCF